MQRMNDQTRIRLASIVPLLPPEAVTWLQGLDPIAWTATEHVLNVIGIGDFVTHWQSHRQEEQRIACDSRSGDCVVRAGAIRPASSCVVFTASVLYSKVSAADTSERLSMV